MQHCGRSLTSRKHARGSDGRRRDGGRVKSYSCNFKRERNSIPNDGSGAGDGGRGGAGCEWRLYTVQRSIITAAGGRAGGGGGGPGTRVCTD